jgi:hypothetical protein
VKKTQVLLVDDIDGGPAEESVAFGLDGQGYEIDLNRERAADLRDTLTRYAEAGRRANGSAPAKGRGGARARVVRSTPPAPSPSPAPVTLNPFRAAVVDGPDRRSAVRAWGRGPGAAAVARAGLEPVAERGRIAVKVYELYDEATS